MFKHTSDEQRFVLFEPFHDKFNDFGFGPSEDTDHNRHPPILIRNFNLLNGQLGALAFFMRTVKTLIRLGGFVTKRAYFIFLATYMYFF